MTLSGRVDVNLKLGVGDGRRTCTLEIIGKPRPVVSERGCVKLARQEQCKGTFKDKGFGRAYEKGAVASWRARVVEAPVPALAVRFRNEPHSRTGRTSIICATIVV